MGAGLATIGRRVYAVGLYWENSPSGRVAQSAKEAARQPGQQADFYALRAGSKDGRVPQFGLGQKTAGHKEGQPAFAACIANQQPGSWAGAFRLREGTVITVIRDDLILPDGDQIFENESDARERLLQEISFGGLQRIYAPEAWSISGSDSMPVSLLLDERRDITLRSVKIPRNVLLASAAVVVLLLVAIAVTLYLQMAENKQEAVVANVPFEAQQPHYPPPDPKWQNAAMPLEVIENCRAGLAKVPAAVAGWRLGTVQCSGTVIALTWSRERGVSKPPAGATINDTASGATLSIPLPRLNPRGTQELLDQSEITRRYLAQDWPGAIARAPDDPPPPPPPNYNGPWNPPPAPWVKRSFTLTVPVLPGPLPAIFGDLPGAIINNVVLNGASGGFTTWAIDGVIYENRNNGH